MERNSGMNIVENKNRKTEAVVQTRVYGRKKSFELKNVFTHYGLGKQNKIQNQHGK